jgi:hypothetical protein
MNILIKLTCLVGLVIAPMLTSGGHTAEDDMKVEVIEVPAMELHVDTTVGTITPLEEAQ